jgi:hypothetical protein
VIHGCPDCAPSMPCVKHEVAHLPSGSPALQTTPEGLCTACSATQYCREHQPPVDARISEHVKELLFGYCGICYHPLDRCSHCDDGANCACQHDGRGTMTNECEEHQRIRDQRDTLLAALKAMMRYYDTPSGPGDLLAQADAAIAKAEGR